MNILGVSALYHDSAASLCIDGNIVAAVQEERFTRKKADASIPKYSIEYCLSLLDGELDAVVYYDNVFLTIDRWIKNALAEHEDKEYIINSKYEGTTSEKIWIKDKIFECIPESKRKKTRFYCTQHHISHAASAFYPSPFKEAAILTIDGVGEWATTTIGYGNDKDIKLLKQINYPHSLGLLYSAFTYYCGFKVNTGEYKLMGLAPYGRPIYVDLIYEKLIDVKSDGSFSLNLDYFTFTKSNVMTDEKFEQLFGIPRRIPEERITRHYMDVAASIQRVTEEVVLKLARHAKEITKSNNLVLAGGTALNCVVNGKIEKEKMFENIWIQPAAGDAGGALGAALYCEYIMNNASHREYKDSMKGSFLGPNFSNEQIERYLRINRFPYEVVSDDEIYSKIAKFIYEGKVIGLLQGRMEFGPRSLGGRSIIAAADSDKMQSRINLKVKFRESFRPFAPAVLDYRKEDYFDINFESPYMLFVKDVKKEIRTNEEQYDTDDLIKIVNQKRSDIPAVTHVDYSARIQTVDEDRNPYFYNVLEEYNKISGCGVVVNTSFNVRGEPIVCTPKDAYLCFMRTDMDVLVLENCILYKERQPEFKEDRDWRDLYELD